MDEAAFRIKLKQYKDTVYRIAYTYLQNTADAEDISQETFLKFYLRETPFPDEGSEKAWLICGGRCGAETGRNSRRIWQIPLKRRRTMHCMRQCSLCRKNTGWSSCSTTTRTIPSRKFRR